MGVVANFHDHYLGHYTISSNGRPAKMLADSRNNTVLKLTKDLVSQNLYAHLWLSTRTKNPKKQDLELI